MPTYEYRCKLCNYEFEEFQLISEEPLIICPKCAEPSLKRLLSSGGGLVFKGNGFYLTDYKKSPAPTESNSSKTATIAEKKDKSESKETSKKNKVAAQHN